jgi:hypothetical protein
MLVSNLRNLEDEAANPAEAEGTVVCLCHFCSSWVVFEATRASEILSCPQCRMSTELYLPGTAATDWRENFPFEFKRIAWALNDQGHRCVVGEVLSLAEKDLAWMRIKFHLFDCADNVIGTSSDCIVGVPAGTVWRFQAPVLDPRAVRASLPIISTEFGSVDMAKPFPAQEEERGLASRAQADEAARMATAYCDRFVGKARTMGAAAITYKQGVKPHWSVGKHNSACSKKKANAQVLEECATDSASISNCAQPALAVA